MCDAFVATECALASSAAVRAAAAGDRRIAADRARDLVNAPPAVLGGGLVACS